MHEIHELYVNKDQLAKTIDRLEEREAKVDKLIAAKNEQRNKLIAQITAPRGGNSGDGAGEEASAKLNDDKVKRAKAKKEQNKAKKKAELRKQLADLEEDTKADKMAAFKKQLSALKEE